jgi:hypothetical protein
MKFFLFIPLLLFFSCNEQCENGKQASASIEYSGMVAADGCDWVVRIDSVSYHPVALDSAFKKENLNVNICYEETGDSFSCGMLPGGIPVINVLEIKE